MVVFIDTRSRVGILAAAAYITVGAVLPLINGKRGGSEGMAFRNAFGDMNSFVLDALRGLDETIQYGCGEKQNETMREKSEELGKIQKQLNCMERAAAVCDQSLHFGHFHLLCCL